MVEVKPDKQTRPPAKPERVTKRFLYEAATYTTNEAKWEAATKYCEKHGMEFLIITEKDIDGNKKEKARR